MASEDKEKLKTDLERDFNCYGAACVKISWDDEKSDAVIERVSPFEEKLPEMTAKGGG